MASSEHQFCLLHISRYDLWRIHRTLVQLLLRDNYTISDALLQETIGNEEDFFAKYIRYRQQSHSDTRPNVSGGSTSKEKKHKRKRKRETKGDASEDAEEDGEDEEEGEEKKRQFMTSLSICGTRSRDAIPKPADKVIVVFGTDEIMGVKAVEELGQILAAARCYNVLVVTAQGFTSFVSQPLGELKLKYSIRTYLHQQLLHSPKDNVLVAPHFLVGDAERKQFVEHYKLTEEKLTSLPKMFDTDAIARYHDWKPNTLVKIVVPGLVPNYRLVIEKQAVFN